MNDHAQTLRQKFIAAQPQQPLANKSLQQKLVDAIDWLGTKWCLHQQSTLEYRRES